MVKLRFKPLKNGKFSAYLDIYAADESGKKKRTYEFLEIHLSKDYSSNKVKVEDEDEVELTAAKTIRSNRELEILNGRYDIKIKQSQQIDTNYLIFLEKEVKRKKSNVDYNIAVLKHTKAFAKGKTLKFADITQEWCEDFKSYLFSQVSVNTVRAYLQVTKLFLNIAVEREIISKNPMTKVPLPKLQEVQRTTLDIEELRLLQSTPTSFGYQLREAFFFACFTGLRLADIRKLKWNDITNGKLMLRPEKTPNKIVPLPLSEQAKQILNGIEKDPDNELVFHRFTINKSTIGDYLEKWGLKAGLKQHLHFHASRHTFATIGITNGIDIYTMKELLVHSKIEMTQIYAKIVDEKKVSEVAKFPTL